MKIKTRRYYIYYLLKTLMFILALMPRKVSLFMAEALGRAAYRFLGKYRDITIKNLDVSFPESAGKNEELAKKVFVNMAKNGADWIKLLFSRRGYLDDLITGTEGMEHLDSALMRGRGVVVLTAHMGNWELLASFLRRNGYDGAVIVKKLYFSKFNKIIMRLRALYNAQVIYRDESPKKMIKILKEGKILGLLADQDIDSLTGVFVNFFGRPAYTPIAPVKLGMVNSSSIVPVFVIRKPDDTYLVSADSPIELPEEEDKELVTKKYTQAWTDVLEKYVRRYPDQWVWVHDRWKTVPDGA
ncbi:MAG: lysophospholipid acyltransferase family protein [Candidatus Omnitrophica bacterium]|nr:lysophospholipid acyltransferase family protein [Candidatus Omnitrophota bacterium]